MPKLNLFFVVMYATLFDLYALQGLETQYP